jgi:CBS-domain-containing membrane protein
MRTTVYTIGAEATLRDAMQLMAQHMIGILPVIDEDRHILGVVVLDDILTRFMPQFVDLLHSTDPINDSGVLETGRQSGHLVNKSITEVMRPPYSIRADTGLVEAMLRLHRDDLTDAPVVDEDDRLVGLVSNVRVDSIFLLDWINHLTDEN